MENLEKSWNFKMTYFQIWKSPGRKIQFPTVLENVLYSQCSFTQFDLRNKQYYIFLFILLIKIYWCIHGDFTICLVMEMWV